MLISDWLRNSVNDPIARRHPIIQINLRWRHLTVGLDMTV